MPVAYNPEIAKEILDLQKQGVKLKEIAIELGWKHRERPFSLTFIREQITHHKKQQ